MTESPRVYTDPPLPFPSDTAMCECSHHWYVHAESGRTARSAVCHGYTGSATPGPFEPCRCTGWRPWPGPLDARTGEPVRPLTMAVDARVPAMTTPDQPVPDAVLGSAARRAVETERKRIAGAIAAEGTRLVEAALRRLAADPGAYPAGELLAQATRGDALCDLARRLPDLLSAGRPSSETRGDHHDHA